MPQLIKDYLTLREQLPPIKGNREQIIGFVPTMGALHDGHLKLVEESKKHCDITVVSIFVNPKQFSEGEDLDAYPRTLEYDQEKLAHIGADILYAPSVAEMYPNGFQTTVSVSQIGQGLCGGSRPGHFDGVCTVVSKLLLQVIPDIAFFGEKDFQQLKVIERMVEDLSMPVTIYPVATMRESSGLAMSSRNQYLNENEQKTAPKLYQTLTECAQELKGGSDISKTLEQAKKQLSGYGFKVDYLELRHTDNLTSMSEDIVRSRLFVAAYLGTTRLIDNLAVE